MNLIFTGEHGSELNIYEAVVEGLQVLKSKFGRPASAQIEVRKVCKCTERSLEGLQVLKRSVEDLQVFRSKFGSLQSL